MKNKEIKTFEELVEFLKNRFPNYDIVEYPEIEEVYETRERQVGEDKYGYAIVEQYQDLGQEHICDNLAFINKKTKSEEVTLPNTGFNNFQNFNSTEEIIAFLDNKLIVECEDGN